MRRFRCLSVALVSVALWACGSGGDPQAIQKRVELKRFESCGQLEDYIKELAIKEMTLLIDESIKSLDQWYWGPVGSPDAGMAAADAGAAPSGEPTSPDDGPAAHTTTNTQVEDVDEPDFVKNDGKRILVLSGGKLYAAKSWPPSELSLASHVSIEGNPTQMFLDKDRVVIFSSVYTESVDTGSCIGGYGCGYNGNALKVTVVDVSDLAHPKVTGEIVLPGSYHSGRRIGAAVRIVLSDYFRWPQGVRFYPDYDSELWNDVPAMRAAYEQLKRDNRKLIASTPLERWLPEAMRRFPNGAQVNLPYSCTDFYRPTASVRLGIATVVSLNLDNLSAQPSRTSVVGGVDEIYASKDSLYLAGRHWWWWAAPENQEYTYLHKFDIKDPNKARYVASGGVEGHLLDQFAMDEHKGFFRVATTLRWWEETPDNEWGESRSVNRVSVLGENAGHLELVGQTKGLAEGEQIYSVRFQGQRGYVVTFRQVDPLFTLDLSNPKAPKVVGELKVPGFSTYIHPLDDNHLLTIGVHVPDPNETTDWRERSMKLTIFDVSNFAAPKEKFTEKVGTAYSWSEAAYEHKAFNYFPQRKLLAIPFSDYDWDYSNGSYWDSFISEVRVFAIDVNKGITPKGALSMKDIFIDNDDYGWYGGYSPWIRRSVMATDHAGIDYVYAIADVGIRVAAVDSLDQMIKTVVFEQ